MNRRHLHLAVAAAFVVTGIMACAPLRAQGTAAATGDWPNKPVRIIHGFTSCGPVDNLARLVAAQFP